MRALKINIIVLLSYSISFFVICRLLLNPERVYRHITMERKVRVRHGAQFKQTDL